MSLAPLSNEEWLEKNYVRLPMLGLGEQEEFKMGAYRCKCNDLFLRVWQYTNHDKFFAIIDGFNKREIQKFNDASLLMLVCKIKNYLESNNRNPNN